MINRNKCKAEHSSCLGDSVRYDRKVVTRNVDGVVKDGRTLISGSCKKGVFVNRKSKRKISYVLRKVIRGRKKRKMDRIDKIDEIVEPVDRISELPEPIIHHILSLLRCPKDVTRTIVWSKKWRSIWASFFTFDFDQKKFQTSRRNHPGEFITFVDNSLATKLEPMHNIRKFKISLSQASILLILPMNNWINAAINKNVKELEVHVEEDSVKVKRHYLLPNTVFTSKNLTSLKLYGCKFDGNIIINLCNLKELSIKNAYVNTDLINNFIQGCPLVEDLRLIHCRGIGHLHISTLHKLHRVQLQECHGLLLVDIESTSLVSFLCWVKSSWACDLKLEGCENLKSLSIKDASLTDKLLQDLIIKFPYLENLALRECISLERITILSRTLKELSVIRCKNLKDPLIDAPNLSAFEYSGERMPFFIKDISSLHEAKLQCQIRKKGFALCRELEQFLEKFVKNGAWKLVVSSKKNITIHEELRRVQHLSSNKLNLELTKSPMKLKKFVDNLLRMSRPKTLSLVSSSSSELLNFLKEKIMSREKNPKCCTYYLRKCWLHYIKDVTMVVLFEGDQIGDTSQDMHQTTFKFQWQPLKSKQQALFIFVATPWVLIMDTSIQLGGNVGSYWDDGVHSGVRKITLVYGSCIDSICVTYDDDGISFQVLKHGGMGGTKSAQIKLQFPEEILIGVSGHFYPVVYGGFPVVRSLTLTSNRRTFGPFGMEEGTPFNFFTNGGHIVGFYGRSGWFLDSIGFHLSRHRPNLFKRVPVIIKGSNRRPVEDEEHQKAKSSKGYSWGI